MSLNRLALRLAVLSALNNNGQAPWPTIAGEKVYDSAINDLEDIAREGVTPVVIVYTDNDAGSTPSQSFRVSDRTTTMTIDIALAVRGHQDAGDEPTLGVPATDDELEMTLDILEAQVMDCLASESEAADIARTIMTGHGTAITSQRGATREGGHRLAGRSIVITTGRLQDWPAGGTPSPHIPRLLALLAANPMRSAQVPLLTEAFSRGAPAELATQVNRILDLAAAHRSALGLPLPGAPALPEDHLIEGLPTHEPDGSPTPEGYVPR